MGILTGFLCLLCFCLLGAKGITRKFGLSAADNFFMKLHKPLSAALLIIGLIHLICALSLIKTRHISVYLSGAAILITLVLLITLCHICRDDRLRLKQHRLLTCIMLLCIVLHIVSYSIDYGNYRSAIADIHLSGTDFSRMPDGNYEGEYDAGYIYAKVQVTLRNGRITHIDLLSHDNERGKAAEQVLDVITDTQTLPVDAVSGATCSSLVIQKAVENALIGGISHE